MSDSNRQYFDLVVDEAFDRARLDRFVAAKIEGLSRVRAQALIRQGLVRGSGGTLVDGAQRVKLGQQIAVSVPAPEPAEPMPEAISLDVVFEDDQLLVVNKPAGMVVHPSPGHSGGTLVNALLAHCGDTLSGIGGVRRPGIVHRLDKETSGLMVVAKTDLAHGHLAAQFAAHGADGQLERAYLALVWGGIADQQGTIDAPLGRSSLNRTKIAVRRGGDRGDGRRAVTHYRVLERFVGRDGREDVCLCRAILETGRTHQIRVHFAHIGHPLLGDSVYGAGFAASARRLSDRARQALTVLSRQALHAELLGFEHPVSGERMRFECRPPAEMLALIAALLGQGETTV